MIPSSSARPASSASKRPASSMSMRPSSSMPVRSASRLSARPISRASRMKTSRVLPLSQTLVEQVTNLSTETDEANFRTAVDYVAQTLENNSKGAASIDMNEVNRSIHGHAQKARINSRDELAEALESSFARLKTKMTVKPDLDEKIQLANLPSHLQFLMALSSAPAPSTLTYASVLLQEAQNPPPLPSALTWTDILRNNPFEGQHWEGVYGMPPGSTVEGYENQSVSSGSTPSLSRMDEEDESNSDDSDELGIEEGLPASRWKGPLERLATSPIETSPTAPGTYRQSYEHRRRYEELVVRQYWRPEWKTDAPIDRRFDLANASTLGPAVSRILRDRTISLIDGPKNEKYINEHDAVREILIALQGRSNMLMEWAAFEEGSHCFQPMKFGARLVHLSLNSQASIISVFATTATHIHRLREFIAAVFSTSTAQNTRTLEAFADAVDHELRAFDRWCAAKEEELCRAHGGAGKATVFSLLSLQKAVQDAFSELFAATLEVVLSTLGLTGVPSTWRLPDLRTPAAATTVHLLDVLMEAIQDHVSRGDETTSNALMRVFTVTAGPVWIMVGRWLRNGMPVRDSNNGLTDNLGPGVYLETEFFIEDNELDLLDVDFWADGLCLRDARSDPEDDSVKLVPTFLSHVAMDVLSAGKATGLLRTLCVPSGTDIEGGKWRDFGRLLEEEHPRPAEALSADTLSRLVYDELTPYCDSVNAQLARVLVDDCEVWRHIVTVEDLYLMRKGDTMSHFSDLLFTKMDAGQSWSDFHFLNTTFSDTVNASSTQWIDTSLVRLSYRGNKDKIVGRSVKGIDGLLVEYAVPFPLTYLFSPKSIQSYGSIFVFLLQMKRAKGVLERILVRGVVRGYLGGEMKMFYAMRSRLSWFINTLFSFVSTFVVHTQVQKFHEELHKAHSLDDMIAMHEDHITKIKGRCLLQPNTSALHGAIMSILDMALQFADHFVAVAGDTSTHDTSRLSVSLNPRRKHRSRRQRRQRRNVVGLSIPESPESTEDENEGNFDGNTQTSVSMAVSSTSSGDDGSSSGKLEKMSTELDGLIRFLRRGVESLAGGKGEAAPAFEVLAFALDDWDA